MNIMATEYRKHKNTRPFEWEINSNGCFVLKSHGYDSCGYGVTFRNGKCVRIHRLIYEQCYGEIPKGMVIMHRCDNPACINPEHLQCGTQAENIKDMDNKGRRVNPQKYYGPRGTETWCSKLTEEQVLKIREDKRSQSQISKEYGISRGYVAQIRNKKNWGWLQ